MVFIASAWNISEHCVSYDPSVVHADIDVVQFCFLNGTLNVLV